MDTTTSANRGPLAGLKVLVAPVVVSLVTLWAAPQQFSLLVQALLGLSRDGFTLVALLGYLLYLNWQLTLIVAVVVPGVAWIMKTLSRRLYHLTKVSQQATDELAYVVEENVLAHRMVRLHGAQEGQARRFEGLSHSLRRLAIKSTIASAAMTPLTQLLAAAALSVVICIALWQSRGAVDAKGVTVGGFAAFITAMLMLIAPIRRLADVASPITRGVAALERGLALLGETGAESGGRYRTDRVRGELALESGEISLPARARIGGVAQEVPSLVGRTGAASVFAAFVEIDITCLALASLTGSALPDSVVLFADLALAPLPDLPP